jgi:hypothetical protein
MKGIAATNSNLLFPLSLYALSRLNIWQEAMAT